MRRESSEQRRGSATITNRRGTFFVLLALISSPQAGIPLLLASTGACATSWTGSVGAILGKDNDTGRLFVRETPAGMGAAKAGIEVEDEVVAIDGKPVAGMTAVEVHEALAGKVGTRVKVSVKRHGAPLDFVVERGPLTGT